MKVLIQTILYLVNQKFFIHGQPYSNPTVLDQLVETSRNKREKDIKRNECKMKKEETKKWYQFFFKKVEGKSTGNLKISTCESTKENSLEMVKSITSEKAGNVTTTNI